MAIYDDLEEINLGNVVNDGTGDDLRTAFEKVKTNLAFLYNNGYAPVSAENIGSTGVGIFKQKNTNSNLELRKLDGVDAVKLTLVGDTIQVSFDPSAAVDFNGQNITNVGSITATTVDADITGTLTGNVVGLIRNGGTEIQNPFVDVTLLNRQVNTFDYGGIEPTYTNPIAYLLNEIGTDMGTITEPSPISIDAGTIA